MIGAGPAWRLWRWWRRLMKSTGPAAVATNVRLPPNQDTGLARWTVRANPMQRLDVRSV